MDIICNMGNYKHTSFKNVSIDDLTIGKKYFIKFYVRGRYENRIGIFIKYVNNYFASFKVTYYGWSLDYYLEDTSYFYDFLYKKDKIQYAMELRAINKIIRNVICDETFNYNL